MGCVDEYLDLWTGRTAAITPRMRRLSTQCDRSRPSARSHPRVEPSLALVMERDGSESHVVMRE